MCVCIITANDQPPRAAVCASSSLFGLVYHGLGGPRADRYARTFIALAALMFLVFVPRFSAWRRASGKP